MPQWWLATYRKFFVFYLLALCTIRTVGDVLRVALGFAVNLLLYQSHTLLDFLRGCCYVYQQGMKRNIGIWSSRGIGAANGFGSVSLFGIPFA
ncbi:MAG: hypothetical protein GF344_04525 [Chitinivibrionales bacterium]|nr:hypothetical protein [Chitinivibrionales bacterium]